MVNSVGGDLPLASIDSVRVGDLVFCNKRSAMQRLLQSVGDPWRHVGLVTEREQEVVSVAEGGSDNTFFSRSLDDILQFYDVVAIGRIARIDGKTLQKAITWTRSRVGSDQLYPWDDVLMTGMILATRNLIAFENIDRLEKALRTVAGYNPPPNLPSMTCSAFVYEAFRHAGHALTVNLGELGPVPNMPGRSDGRIPALEGLDSSEQVIEFLARSNLWQLASLDQSDVNMVNGRGNSRSHASVSQLLQTAALLAKTVEQYSQNFPRGNGIDGHDLDGRWISPGDLWRSASLTDRSYLKV